MNTFKQFDPEHQLFVYQFADGSGYSTIGLAYAQRRVKHVANWVQCPVPPVTPDEEGFKTYQTVMHFGEIQSRVTGYRCKGELVPELVGLEGKHVEVVNHDGDISRFWVGKSTGWMPCHLALKRRSSPDGDPVYGAPFKSVKVIK
jgi:hypothetical protein